MENEIAAYDAYHYLNDKLFVDLEGIVAKYSTQKEVHEKMEVAKNFIHQNWDKSVSIKDISSHIALCESRFFYFFKLFYACSPHEYITSYKMQKAVELQKELGLSWTEIAEMCAYTDISAFSRQFKKSYGVSPRFFRK